MRSNLDIGIRHILGIYPFLFVAIGCALDSILQTKKARNVISALMILLAFECYSSFPNYIPFFNAAATHTAGKLYLLGDSNLDWGQDLPLLAQWQREHPKEKLYLSYFGSADPKHYGLKYDALPGGHLYEVTPGYELAGQHYWWNPVEPCVIAISASNLQGILLDEKYLPIYAGFKNRKPIAVLGDSIYLYRYDP